VYIDRFRLGVLSPTHFQRYHPLISSSLLYNTKGTIESIASSYCLSRFILIVSNGGDRPAVPPRRGGIHSVHGVFLGGGAVDDAWAMPTSSYRFSTQRHDVRYIAKIERGLTDARDSASSPKFNGKMDVASGDTAKLDKDRFV
jgi:hypothetical protein